MTIANANDVKIQVLAWAIPRLTEDEVLGSEVHYMDGARRADLAVASYSRLVAIEIKGPRDNLDKLKLQTDAYLSMFLETYVATTVQHVAKVKGLLPKSVGVIVTDDKGVDVYRKASVRKSLTADQATRWLSFQDLVQLRKLHPSLSAGLISVEEMRAKAAASLGSGYLTEYALQRIKKRLQKRHDVFISELGRTPTLDDVHMLTVERKIKL